MRGFFFRGSYRFNHSLGKLQLLLKTFILFFPRSKGPFLFWKNSKKPIKKNGTMGFWNEKSDHKFFVKRFEPTGRDISEFYSNTFTRRGGLNRNVKKPGWDEASKLSNTHLEVAKNMFPYPSLPNSCSEGLLGRILGFKYLLNRCLEA